MLPGLENNIQRNREQAYKFATITVRVYVDLDELEQAVENGYQDPVSGEFEKFESEPEAFDYLARQKILSLFPTDEPCKHYETDLS